LTILNCHPGAALNQAGADACAKVRGLLGLLLDTNVPSELIRPQPEPKGLFSGRILPVTRSIAERWDILEGQRQLVGRPLNVPDGQIAATALEHGQALS
jgi:predicted nucleic acid-binding protein